MTRVDADRRTVQRVVGALDDSDLTEPVARAAAAEAHRRPVPLLFVRVVDQPASWPDARHEPALRRALSALPPGGSTEPLVQLVAGAASDALVRAVTASDLLVIGAGRARGALGNLLGSTCARVLRHATSSVLVVPSDPATRPERERWPVVAGVGLDDDQDTVLATAFDEAAVRGVSVRILHSCRPGHVREDTEAEARAAIGEVVEREQRQHPDVRATVHVSFLERADLLTGSTHRASLIVVGHRPHDGSVRAQEHLTRAVLRHSEAPLLSVPVAAHDPSLQPTA